LLGPKAPSATGVGLDGVSQHPRRKIAADDRIANPQKSIFMLSKNRPNLRTDMRGS